MRNENKRKEESKNEIIEKERKNKMKNENAKKIKN